MLEIIPAIIPQSIGDLEAKLQEVFRYVSRVQLDIMDGNFVKAKSWPYNGGWRSFEAILGEEEGLPLWDNVDFEIDLMVTDPEEAIEQWIIAGASRIVVHIESAKRMNEIVDMMNERFMRDENGSRDVELGIALNIDTETETILPYLEDVDFIQFMGIETIGYQGQPFDERVLDKIRDFHNAHPEVIISVDGGVNLETAPALIDVGVQRLVVGSAIFDSKHISTAIQSFKNLSIQ